jgi:hypothetical protein
MNQYYEKYGKKYYETHKLECDRIYIAPVCIENTIFDTKGIIEGDRIKITIIKEGIKIKEEKFQNKRIRTLKAEEFQDFCASYIIKVLRRYI